MTDSAFLLFKIWFLLLPFSILSSLYFSVAGLAVDKVLSPFLVAIWLVLALIGKSKFNKDKMKLAALVLVFLVARNISFASDVEIFLQLIWRDAIVFGYFLLPLLYIDRPERVDTGARLVSINAVVGCLSAFLVAFGVFELPYERFSESRIGFEDIKKSIGLITAYGDVAQLAAFFLVLGFYLPDRLLPLSARRLYIVRLMVVSVVVMGLIGNQSRSYLLSVLAALLAGAFFSYRERNRGKTFLIDALAWIVVFVLFPVFVVMMSDIVSFLGALGGHEAMGTANARLLQYAAALDVIKQFPIFGIDAEFYRQNPDFAHGVHNIWIGQLTKGGIVSVMLFVAVLVIVFRKCVGLFRSSRTKVYARVMMGYLAAVFVSVMFYPADSDIFWALFGMVSSLVYVLSDSALQHTSNTKKHKDKTDKGQARILSVRKPSSARLCGAD